MIKYTELNDHQLGNLFCFLDRSTTHHLDKLKSKYNISSGGKGLNEYRQKILDNVMMEQIPFNEFLNWLADVDMEGNSSIFIYEPENSEVFNNNTIDKTFDKLSKRIQPLYSIDAQTLKKITLVKVNKDEEKKQLVLTFAAPAQLQIKNKEKSETVLKNHVYLAYFIIDYNLKHIVLITHPTSNLISLAGETKKEWDDLTWILLHAFNNEVFKIELKDPDWLIDALFLITEEYFHHHNPLIDKKMNEIKKSVLPNLLKTIQGTDTSFAKDEYKYRFERALVNMFENELTTSYGRINIQAPFEVFLHQSDKGVTEFRANSRGRALNYADAGEIVKLMWDTGDIASLGIIYTQIEQNELLKKHPYKISKTNKYYSFKKYNTSSTKKEVIDDVLQIFSKYKQRVQSSSASIANSKQGTDNAET
ncbi:hypothetical protein ABET51_02900 [Metabacillus fastidiosus]|uniref:hypothetical protein n=1 Tax=Metabacillus fastidiosus TaxID=1458 RepID=UPI003D274593